jgi:hypothetical protein
MTTEEWVVGMNAIEELLVEERKRWHSMFVMRIGPSSVPLENPLTIIISCPDLGELEGISARIINAVNQAQIKDVYLVLSLSSWSDGSSLEEIVSMYKIDQFQEHPKIGLGYSVGIAENSKKSFTLGGSLELKFPGGKYVFVGITNFHPVRDLVSKSGTFNFPLLQL